MTEWNNETFVGLHELRKRNVSSMLVLPDEHILGEESTQCQWSVQNVDKRNTEQFYHPIFNRTASKSK